MENTKLKKSTSSDEQKIFKENLVKQMETDSFFSDFSWTNDNLSTIPLPFCDSSARRIVEPLYSQFKSEYEDLLFSKMGIKKGSNEAQKIEKGFPGSLPVFILKDNLKDVLSCSILPKTDGERYFIVFITILNQKKAFVINRSNHFYGLKISGFTAQVYDGTIFDGEIHKRNNQWYFSIFDTILDKGVSCIKDDHYSRMEKAKNIIKNIPINTNNPFLFTVKEYINVFELKLRMNQASVETKPSINNNNSDESFVESNNDDWDFDKKVISKNVNI